MISVVFAFHAFHSPRQRDRLTASSDVDRLPHKLKAALILFSIEGCLQREAADILGTTPKTVETRVYHAKEKLRQLLDGTA
jgi:DNA-directed RNA polymerase specialized sigma24 family protein